MFILLSILVCAAASLFCACLVSVQVSAPLCHSWQHTGVVHLSLQADGKVAFEDIPVFGVCRPACHDSSLYLFVLVLFLEAVVLFQVHVAWDNTSQHYQPQSNIIIICFKCITHTVVIITYYKRMGYVIIPKPNCSCRHRINSGCRHFDLLLFRRFGSICRRYGHSCHRSGCRCSDWSLASNCDSSYSCLNRFSSGRRRLTMTAVTAVTGSFS